MNLLKSSRPRVCILASILLLAVAATPAQEPVSEGRGSYASFTPLIKGRTDAHGGDQSALLQTRRLWVDERPGRPIPTNDWWTGIINAPYADALWSYPAMVHPSERGIDVNYPTRWSDNGSEVLPTSRLQVGARGFRPTEARARDWHDWDVVMAMPGADGRTMVVTLVHGQPFTWVEFEGRLTPTVTAPEPIELFDPDGVEVTARALRRYPEQMIGLRVGSDCYGLYLPEGCSLSLEGNVLTISEGAPYLVVALLPGEAHLRDFADYAWAVPRDTRVDWSYDERRGQITSTWSVTAEDLRDHTTGHDVLQGFLPHAYKSAVQAPAFGSDTYLTPRGTMKMAAGCSFAFTHAFAGMLPWYPHPAVDDSAEHPYRPEVMAQLIEAYARRGTFGDDTYWGGKGLVQMALNMTFALQSGQTEMYELSRRKLRDKLVDWLTYTPGENRVYFAAYPRWGAIVGQDPSYDSDSFNDHHFHYGYYTLAGAMLCMVDEDFCRDYGPMLRLVAKEYANWDRTDTRFPFLRTLDPWVGHSYAGGLGDQGNSNGNGQESSSEAMQGWGGVYLLGVAMNDRQMRDAGIFGWSMEARATREYWFDVDARFDRHGLGGNYDHSLYKHPYNTNITCKGIGWWTWFSGDPLHMHGIQWMPVSPALDYMSWDPDFVRWAYTDLMTTPGWGHKWFEDGTNPDGGHLGMLANDDWGNVTLSYMQRAMPQEAAAIFDEALERGSGIATAISTGHISYYVIHSHLTYGEIDLTVHADLPSANAYIRPDGAASYAVYNPGAERDVTFYRDGAPVRTVRAPGRRFTVFTDAAALSRLELTSTAGQRFPSSTQLAANAFDQYGASVALPAVEWAVSDPAVGQVSPDGRFAFTAGTPDGAEAIVTARCGAVEASLTLTCGQSPHVAALRILPEADFVERGTALELSADVTDQYGLPMDAPVAWTLDGAPLEQPVIDGVAIGRHRIAATAGSVTAVRDLAVLPLLPNVAAGCPAVVSSTENDGMPARNLTDGDPSTRWGSTHRDGQWAYVDLGRDFHITRIGVLWEAAFASAYDLQIIPDGTRVEESAWQTVASVSGLTSAGLVETGVGTTGRYVRVLCRTRSSSYGISIYELSVCGVACDAPADQLAGIDIAADRLSVDDCGSARFKACAYTLAGTPVEADVAWSCDQGSITPEGVFYPAKYGLATVTATSGRLSASATIPVNETVRLHSLRVEPAELSLTPGLVGHFSLEALDQFGGPVSTAPGAISVEVPQGSGVVVDLAAGTIAASATGVYTVRFVSGEASAELRVDCREQSGINIALNRPVEVCSGANATAITDGNTATRWQATPGGEQWLSVELDDVYTVSRFELLWEAARASEYAIEGSIDGRNWAEIVRAKAGATLAETVECQPVPVRLVRLKGLVLSDAARVYGMSLFEFGVYATARLSASDAAAPAIVSASVVPGAGAVSAYASATDTSGFVYLTLTAREDAAFAPRSSSATVIARSGSTGIIDLGGLMGNAVYTCTVTATDPWGNASSREFSATTAPESLEGVNLARGAAVTVSSAEDAGLAGANAVDGNASTRWGSKFNDGEWLMADLGDCFRVNTIVITTNDAAYAKRALLEASVDGLTWTSLGVRTASAIGTDRVQIPPTPMRYLRYTGLERATGYGISIAELEVYGDLRMLSVSAREAGDFKLTGCWDDAIFAAIDSPEATSYDLTSVQHVPVSLSAANPNCILFVRSAISADCNVAVLSGGVASARSIAADERYPFSSPADIAVSEGFTLDFAAVTDRRAVVLPVDFEADRARIRAYAYSSVDADSVWFKPSEHVRANVPLMVDAPGQTLAVAGPLTLSATTDGVLSDGALRGTYTALQPDGRLAFDLRERAFVAADEPFSPFGAYLALRDGRPRSVSLAERTALADLPADSEPVDVYTLEGICLRRGADPSTALRGLAPGFYILVNRHFSKVFQSPR